MATTTKAPARNTRRWSQDVTEHSDAMDLARAVFKQTDPEAIARSLKASAGHSDRRRADAYRSAMSMLTFSINRAGHHLEPAQHERLERAKESLRDPFGKTAPKIPATKSAAKKSVTKTAANRKA